MEALDVKELDPQLLEQVSGGNAQDTVTGSFGPTVGVLTCYAVGDHLGISRMYTRHLCE